ncbi:unnamed protein product [Protopolystoma xenopodis]|uniref:C2H2-type domain-containing protein n=1 Tax=Protopolystoma xenopodis TaxID=117903 RepID=A0A448X1L9_9PLAT|nr:unnamed protein product [Protopolystoma xenopodis]
MQTHYPYRCLKCDYTSRTEGRLKRHLKDFHSNVPPDNFSGKAMRPSKPKLQKCKQIIQQMTATHKVTAGQRRFLDRIVFQDPIVKLLMIIIEDDSTETRCTAEQRAIGWLSITVTRTREGLRTAGRSI